MGPDGPRVIDFGIARALDSGGTMTSQVVGTPAYMAPEQFSGRVGPSTDLFAWAGTLLFAATGRDPFAGGPPPAVMYRIMHEMPDVGVLPEPLAEVAEACLAKDPHARPTSEDVLFRLLGRRGEQETATGHVPEPATSRPAGDEPAPEPPGGTAPYPPDPAWPVTAGYAPRPKYRGLPRGPALVTGLLLAGFLAALDVGALAILIARPALSEGHRGGLLPVVASSFAVVAVVTLVAVILAWRGSRAAVGTVMAARVARVAMWAAWGALVHVQVSALVGHALLTALVVVLLARGLARSPL
jgi:hypothetical protein